MASAERAAHKKKSFAKPTSNARLDPMIEEVIVDAYGESEQIAGLYTMLDNNLAVPFQTAVLDVEVRVNRVVPHDLADIVHRTSLLGELDPERVANVIMRSRR